MFRDGTSPQNLGEYTSAAHGYGGLAPRSLLQARLYEIIPLLSDHDRGRTSSLAIRGPLTLRRVTDTSKRRMYLPAYSIAPRSKLSVHSFNR
jgi:hypothetical protein